MTAAIHETTAADVADWLNSLDNTSAAPVLVRIGRTEYIGAAYTQLREAPEGSPAARAGDRFYAQTGLYLVGDLPPSYVRSSHTAYRYPNGRRRWYVGSWYDRDEPNEWHPFGRMLQLFPDDGANPVTVDDDGQPYPEVPIHLVRY